MVVRAFSCTRCSKSDSLSNVFQTDTLGLFCSDVPAKFMDLQTKMEWQYLQKDSRSGYVLVRDKYVNEQTGIWSTDSVLFIHPPRFGSFRLLQFCPYPFFYRDSTVWSWDLEIDAHWAIDSLYPIQATEHFVTQYQRVGTETIATIFGKLACSKVMAHEKSKYGTSTATYYLNDQHGIVYYRLGTTNKMYFEFTLLDRIQSIDSLQAVYKYFTFRNEAEYSNLLSPSK